MKDHIATGLLVSASGGMKSGVPGILVIEDLLSTCITLATPRSVILASK